MDSPQDYNPVILLSLSNVLKKQKDGKKALFWFLAGQLRMNVDVKRTEDETAHSGVGILMSNFAPAIAEDMFTDFALLKNTLFEVIEWDKKTPYHYDYRWLGYHGMGAILDSLEGEDKQTESPKTNDELISQWKVFTEKARSKALEDYTKMTGNFITNPLIKAQDDVNRILIRQDAQIFLAYVKNAVISEYKKNNIYPVSFPTELDGFKIEYKSTATPKQKVKIVWVDNTHNQNQYCVWVEYKHGEEIEYAVLSSEGKGIQKDKPIALNKCLSPDNERISGIKKIVGNSFGETSLIHGYSGEEAPETDINGKTLLENVEKYGWIDNTETPDSFCIFVRLEDINLYEGFRYYAGYQDDRRRSAVYLNEKPQKLADCINHPEEQPLGESVAGYYNRS